MSPGAARGTLVIVAIAALAVTPFEAGLNFRSFTCDVDLGGRDWVEAILNPRHLTAFAIISALAVFALRGRPLWQPVALAFAISAGVELEQAFFADGHCRVTDLIPNFIAVVMGAAIGLLIHVWLNRKRD